MLHDDHMRYGIGTRAIHAGQERDEHGSVIPAIYQTSTFAFENTTAGAARFTGEHPGYIYTRMGNPTIRMLEDNVAALEGGARGMACATGMAALNTLFFGALSAGDHLVASCLDLRPDAPGAREATGAASAWSTTSSTPRTWTWCALRCARTPSSS